MQIDIGTAAFIQKKLGYLIYAIRYCSSTGSAYWIIEQMLVCNRYVCNMLSEIAGRDTRYGVQQQPRRLTKPLPRDFGQQTN